MKSDNEATCHNPFSGDCTDERVRNAVDPWFRRGDSRRSTTINSFSTSTTINAAAADVNGNSTIKEPEIEIFGPFFDAARLMCLIPVNHRSEGVRSPGSLAERLISIMTFASCIALVFWRTIHLSTGIKQIGSINWCYTFLLFFYSLHAFISLVLFRTLCGSKEFFRVYFQNYSRIRRWTAAADSKQDGFRDVDDHTPGRKRFALLVLMTLFIFYTAVWFNFDNFREGIAASEATNGSVAELPVFRKSMFGNSLPGLWLLDALICCWTAGVSGLSLALLFLLNQAVFVEYGVFFRYIKFLRSDARPSLAKHSCTLSMDGRNPCGGGEANHHFSSPSSSSPISFFNGRKASECREHVPENTDFTIGRRFSAERIAVYEPRLADAQTLALVDRQLIDLITAIKYTNENTEPLMTFTFLSAVFAYVISAYANRVLVGRLDWVQRMTFGNWSVLSAIFLFVIFVPVVQLHSKLRETKNIVLLEKSIWFGDELAETEVNAVTGCGGGRRPVNNSRYGCFHAFSSPEIASNLVRRIQLVDYESKLFKAFGVTSGFFNLVMLVVPFLVDFIIAPPK